LDREQLIGRMADALKGVTMLDSGTARWAAYERARLINFGPRPRADRINANAGDGVLSSPLDKAALATAKGDAGDAGDGR
jgi:hypothetical protein